MREPLPKKRSALPLPLLCKNSSGAIATATFLASQVATATATRYSLLYLLEVEGVPIIPKNIVTFYCISARFRPIWNLSFGGQKSIQIFFASLGKMNTFLLQKLAGKIRYFFRYL